MELKTARPIEILLIEDSPSDAALTIEALQAGKIVNNLNCIVDGVEAMAYLRKQGKFTEMKTALWSRLWKTENGRPAAHPEEVGKIDELAATLGLDPARLATDVDGCKQWLQSGERTLTAVGVHGTPAFFINGRPQRDRSFEAFDRTIAQELAKANRSSVAAADYYDREIVAKGLTQVKGRFAD